MTRRDLIALLGGAVASWPVGVRAQQPDRIRRIGVLTAIGADDPEGQVRLTAFVQGLQKLGWTVGQNVRIDYRWGGSNADDTRKYAAELVALAPDVILAQSSASVAPLLLATRTIPVVFTTVADPVGAGFVESCAPRWQCHGFYQLRIFHRREMAGAAQRDCPRRDAGRSFSRIYHSRRGRPVRRNPGPGAVT